MNLSYKDLIDLCHTKARYYQNKASELNDADYLSDSKFCLAMSDYLLKAEQETAHTLSQKATNTTNIEQQAKELRNLVEQEVAEACANWVRSGLHDDDPYIIARGLEDGAWREYL